MDGKSNKSYRFTKRKKKYFQLTNRLVVGAYLEIYIFLTSPSTKLKSGMNYQKINNLTGWAVFTIASITYYLTLEPTVSFWDCGEYISTAYKLEVGHPPGAPLFQLIGRFFSLFATDTSQVAFTINLMSALSSSFTILFLFWSITAFGKKLITNQSSLSNTIAIMGSGAVGALAYTFSDSFWFSAVEGEVYAMSSLFTALTFWAILKWENEAEDKCSARWIIFIAYLIGLSIGVHLLNLLAIPAIVFIYYFKRYTFSVSGFIKTGLAAILLIGGIQGFIIPGIVSLAGKLELFFVNTIGLPFNSGTIFYFLAIIAIITFGLKYAKKKNKPTWSVALLSFAFLLIGYSTFLALVVRSNANTPIDENNPEEAVSLLAYLNREQYGDWPILKGQYYNAQVVGYEDGTPIYRKDEKSGKYIITDNRKQSEYIFDPKYTGFFPRMWFIQAKPHQAKAYKDWSGQKNTKRPPTFGENMKYMFNYQIGHMYMRYFLWNFAGRQNDMQGHGEINKGNWLSGIPFIDNARLGPQENLPTNMANNKGRNTYYMLPLLLGLIGMFFHFQKDNKNAFVVLMLFLFTGLAIVIYLNQYPFQPRERDYAYVGSFYAFAIWIGLGVLAIFDSLSKKAPKNISAVIATTLCLLLVPTIMAKENWDDHDRSNRYTARDVATNYLNSCAPNAIIFTFGDNDTFPLWYAQEVEGVRTDVRVVNLSLFSTEWYIDQMKRAAYESAPIPSKLEWDQYKQGTRDYVPIYDRELGYVEVSEVVDFIGSDAAQTKLPTSRGKSNYCPTNKLKITVDKEAVIKNGLVPEGMEDQIVEEIKWKIKGQGLTKAQMMILDILANFKWERPIYFAITVGSDNFQGLEDYFQLEGLAYRLTPFKVKSSDGQVGKVATDIMFDNLINKFKWGNMGDPSIYLDETNMRMTMNFRNNFARLADALIAEGDYERAEIALDRCSEIMPNEAIPYNYFNIPIANGYYQIGEVKKAQEVINLIADNYFDELDYYSSLDDKTLSQMNRDYQLTNQAIGSIFNLAQVNNDTTSLNKISTLYQEIQQQ